MMTACGRPVPLVSIPTHQPHHTAPRTHQDELFQPLCPLHLGQRREVRLLQHPLAAKPDERVEPGEGEGAPPRAALKGAGRPAHVVGARGRGPPVDGPSQDGRPPRDRRGGGRRRPRRQRRCRGGGVSGCPSLSWRRHWLTGCPCVCDMLVTICIAVSVKCRSAS